MRILLVNDDGIEAEGICTLARRLGDKHELYIAAPLSQRSCYSHKVTYYYRSNYAEERNVPGAIKAWAIDATPADCVYYALHGLMEEKPDLVISGINDGPNMASDVIYSGTIGAAGEALIYRIPAIAVSLCARNGANYSTAVDVLEKCMPVYCGDCVDASYILSINVPDVRLSELKGLRCAVPGGTLDYAKLLISVKEGKGYRLSYDNTPIVMETGKELPDGDVKLLNQGYAVLTPLHNDLCRYQSLPELEKYSNLI